MLGNKRLFLFDIDGTVCQGDRLIDGAAQLLEAIEQCGGRYVFITNNSTKSIQDYILKFQKLGIMTDFSNFITASYAAVQYLKKNYADRLIYVMGTRSLIRELKKNGIKVTTDCEDDKIACVLVAYDSELTYEKLVDTCKLLSTRDVGYAATNPDLVCPIEFGFVPDCGSICEMIAHAVKKEPYYIGKPRPDMVDMSVAQSHFTKEETLVVGDRLYTDILSGVNAGVKTALVLTGEASREDAQKSSYKPDYIFDSVKELCKAWQEEQTVSNNTLRI